MNMKKINLSRIVLLFCVLIVTSCGSSLNDKEKKIVGKWHNTYSSSYSEDDFGEDCFIVDGTFSVESEDKYLSDHTEKEQGTFTFSFHVEDEDYEEWINLTYDLSYEGTWSVNGDELISKGKEIDIDFSKFKTTQEYKPDIDDYYINILKSFVEDWIPEIRHDVLKKYSQKIVNLSDDEITLEDEDGEENTLIRIE